MGIGVVTLTEDTIKGDSLVSESTAIEIFLSVNNDDKKSSLLDVSDVEKSSVIRLLSSSKLGSTGTFSTFGIAFVSDAEDCDIFSVIDFLIVNQKSA